MHWQRRSFASAGTAIASHVTGQPRTEPSGHDE
jgi:hypothetical protein